MAAKGDADEQHARRLVILIPGNRIE